MAVRPRSGRWVVAGLALAAIVAGCAHKASLDESSTAPQVGKDHWHAAFGIYVCDRYLPALPQFESPIGIHTHGDGVIHVHPFTAAGAGDNARVGVFLDGAGVKLADDGVTVAGTTYRRGRDCDGRPATVEVVKWRHVAGDGRPEVVTHDGARLPFQRTGEAYAIAIVPAGTDVPKPPATATLASLDAGESGAGTPPSSAATAGHAGLVRVRGVS